MNRVNPEKAKIVPANKEAINEAGVNIFVKIVVPAKASMSVIVMLSLKPKFGPKTSVSGRNVSKFTDSALPMSVMPPHR